MTEAQRLALELNAGDRTGVWYPSREAAAELRRLDAVEAEWAALSQDDGKAQREIERLRAVNAQLLEALKSANLFLHHCWCDVQMNEYSYEKLQREMESVDAAIAATGETK